MILPRRWLGEIATIDESDHLTLHPDRLIRHLLLFDKVLIYSARLREIEPLLAAFGFDGVIALLRSGAIGIHLHAFTVGSTGQSDLAVRSRKGLLPLYSYSFSSIIGGRTRKEYVSACFKDCVRSIGGLSVTQEIKLVQEIASRLIDPVEHVSLLTTSQFHADLIANAPHLKTSLSLFAKRTFGQNVADAVTIRVIPIDDQDFRVESNLRELAGVDDTATHKAIERALLAVSGVNQRLAEMQSYDALANFWYRDIPILEGKLGFLQTRVAPETLDQRLATVLSLPALPDLGESIAAGQFNVERFLEVRSSDEAVAFRAWLRDSDDNALAELQDHAESLRARIAQAISGTTIRGIRVVSTTALGLLPGASIAAAGLGLVDAFLVERMFGRPSAPLAFLLGRYSSVFERRSVSL